MKVFLSSVIGGFEAFRAAAVEGIEALGHVTVKAEDFGALPSSPQQTCLEGVRAADVMVLVLGERYGYPQAGSGLSATHEEYREAKSRLAVLAFIQAGVSREAAQEIFVQEVQDWSGGLYTENFTSPKELQSAVTKRLHQLELANASGSVNPEEMLARAEALLPGGNLTNEPSLVLAVASGPKQQVLRPVEIESDQLARNLTRGALFGDEPLFTPEEGTSKAFENQSLVLRQEHSSIHLDELGSIRIILPAIVRNTGEWSGLSALIEEEILVRIERALRFSGWLLDEIDAPGRLTEFVPVVALLNASYLSWRTRSEHERQPNRVSVPFVTNEVVVHLSPIHRRRGALRADVNRMAEDLMVLLRRCYLS